MSKFLKTSGLDILKAFQMVSQTCIQLNKLVRDFDAVQKVANEFIACENEELNKFEDSDIEIQANFPQKRIKKRKLMLDETARVEVVLDATPVYKIKVYNVIFDTVYVGMERRFLANGQLYADFSYLDPKRFPEILYDKLQSDELEELSKLMLKFGETAMRENLRTELNKIEKF